MRLTCQTSKLSLAYLKRAQKIYLGLVGQNHLTQSPIYNKMLNISCILFEYCTGMKNDSCRCAEFLYRCRMVVSVVYPCDHVAD